LIAAGTFFCGLGLIGIFIPLLPTTPFLMLAAACYARSSKRFYDWLMNNRWFGRYLKNYREGRGISSKAKLISISLLWLTMALSGVIVNLLLVWVVLIVIAALVTFHISTIPTMRVRCST